MSWDKKKQGANQKIVCLTLEFNSASNLLENMSNLSLWFGLYGWMVVDEMCTKFNPSIMENLMSNFWRLWFSNSFKSIERRFCCWINYWKLLYQFCIRWCGRSIRVKVYKKNRFIILFIHKRKNGDRHDCDTVNFSYFRWKIVHDYREKSGVFFIVLLLFVCTHTHPTYFLSFL